MTRLLAILSLLLPITSVLAEEVPPTIRVALFRDVSGLDRALALLNEREYEGMVRLVQNKQGLYTAINTLDLEEFLLGVVSCEMNPKAPVEALKAQAIAARSHALYQASISEDQLYDLIANLSQAYAGKAKLHKNVILAIEATRGQVLYYENKPFPGYFHASCGGHTETMASVWIGAETKIGKTPSFPKTVVCTPCVQSKEYKWEFEISRNTLRNVLSRAGHEVGSIPSISILTKGAGGHALTLAVNSPTGSIEFLAEKFRSLIGYHNLRSTLFEVSLPANPDGSPGDLIIFKGAGYGHGVGLCQYGAQAMAEDGYDCKRILNHYFPNGQIFSYKFDQLAATPSTDKL
jgi:stage II sporulation protein D